MFRQRTGTYGGAIAMSEAEKQSGEGRKPAEAARVVRRPSSSPSVSLEEFATAENFSVLFGGFLSGSHQLGCLALLMVQHLTGGNWPW